MTAGTADTKTNHDMALRDMALRIVERIEADARVIDAALDAEDMPLAEELRDRAAEVPLEVYAECRRNAHVGDWQVSAIIVVLTTGGPHVQVRWTGTSATLEVWGWFADRVDVELDVDADAVDALYGCDAFWDSI